MADAGQGVDIGLAHGDDLALQPHLRSLERQGLGARELDLKSGASGQGAEMVQNLIDRGVRSGDRAIDPLRRQKQGPLDAQAATQAGQRLAQRCAIREAGEVIEGGDANRRLGVRHGGKLDQALYFEAVI